MVPLEKRNPASLAAGRAPTSLCLAAERSEDTQSRPNDYGADGAARSEAIRRWPDKTARSSPASALIAVAGLMPERGR
jgi:hypothetical protein